MKKKVIYLDIDDTLSGYGKTKVVKSSFWSTYKERMNESWEARVFGITMPLWAIFTLALMFIFPLGEFNWTALILQGTTSLWFIISYGLLIRRQMKDKEQEIKDAIWRDSQKSF